ncbi:MAG: SRPBCC family protein [Steroidobacteraceae bacterium]
MTRFGRPLATLVGSLVLSLGCATGEQAASQQTALVQWGSGMRALKPSEKVIVLERRLAARPPEVFAALTEPPSLRQWMGTAEMALISCDVDLRAGGSFRYTFRRGARTMEVRGAYESVEAPHRFVYAESYDFSPLRLTVATELTDAADGTTLRQTLIYKSKGDRDGDFDGVAASSAEAFTRLDRYLEARRGGVSVALAKSIEIEAAPLAVWDVLTRPESIERWLGTRVRSSWQVGEPIVFEYSWEGKAFEDKGVVRDLRRGEVFAYTYWSGLSGLPDEPHNYSLITFELTPSHGGTTLALRHEQIANERMRDHSNKNWDETLRTIRDLAKP